MVNRAKQAELQKQVLPMPPLCCPNLQSLRVLQHIVYMYIYMCVRVHVCRINVCSCACMSYMFLCVSVSVCLGVFC